MWGSACLRLSDGTFLFVQDSTVATRWGRANGPHAGVVQCQFALGRCPSVHRDYLPIVSIFTTTYQERKQVPYRASLNDEDGTKVREGTGAIVETQQHSRTGYRQSVITDISKQIDKDEGFRMPVRMGKYQ